MSPPPASYQLRSHIHESSTVDEKPKPRAIVKSESENAVDKTIKKNDQSSDGSLIMEQEEDSQTAQNESSHSEEQVMDNKNQETDIISCPMNNCGQILETRKELTEHIKTHCTDATTCPVCEKSLNSSNSRDRHLLIHSGERPYNCTQCPQTFTTNGNMNRHLRKHTDTHKQKKISKDSLAERENISKKGVLPQADTSKEVTEISGIPSDTEEMHRQNNYFQSLGLHRKPTTSPTEKQGKFENHPAKKNKLSIGKEDSSGMISHTTSNGGSLQRKKLKENDDYRSNNANNMIPDSFPRSDLNDAQDLAGITDIISNVQPTNSTNQTSTSAPLKEKQNFKRKELTSESFQPAAKNKNNQKRQKQTKERKGTFICKFCGNTFSNKNNAQRHVKDIHNFHNLKSISDQIRFLKESDVTEEETLTCKYCLTPLDNKQALQHHLRSDECKDKPYQCKICNKGSSTKNNCFRHMQTKHPEMFTPQMTSEEKNKLKEENMRTTIHNSPRQDKDKRETENTSKKMENISSEIENNSKEIEAAESLCRLQDTSCNTLVNIEALVVGTGAVTVETCPPQTSSIINNTGGLPMIPRSSVTISNIENFEDKPLDLSVNPLDLSLKSFKNKDSAVLPQRNIGMTSASKSSMVVSETNGHPQSVNDNNSEQKKCVYSKHNNKNFKCTYCEKTFCSNSNLRRHSQNLHNESSNQREFYNPIRRDHLREFSINSPAKHYGFNQIKNSKNSLISNKLNASLDRGTGSDTENDLASIPSIQSTVNQGIHMANPGTVTSAFHHSTLIRTKRPFSDVQSSDSYPLCCQRKMQEGTGTKSSREVACSPVRVPRVITSKMDHINDESSGGSPTRNPENDMLVCELSKSTHNQSFNAKPTEAAELSPAKDTDLICRDCFSQFSSKEHMNSHIKELHSTQDQRDVLMRWKKKKLRQ